MRNYCKHQELRYLDIDEFLNSKIQKFDKHIFRNNQLICDGQRVDHRRVNCLLLQRTHLFEK